MKKFSCVVLVPTMTATALTGCNPAEWPGAGSDTSITPQVGGYPDAGFGTHFGSWVNNSYGPGSTIIPVMKNHPPLQGAEICVLEHPEMPCAVTSADGRWDIHGIDAENVHLAITLRDYMPLLIPYDAAQGNYDNHPALEIASLALQDQMFSQLLLTREEGTGGVSFHITDRADMIADPAAADHAESSKTLAGVAVRYRQIHTNINGTESYGSWSSPSSWILGHDVVYLNNDESPDLGALHTSNSGLAIALNLEPGDYEVEADDTNYIGGFGTLLTLKHWSCSPLNKTPKGSSSKRARTKIIDGHLSDIRMYCKKS